MKLKNNFLPAVLFACLAVFSSCEKGEQDAPEVKQRTISQILADSTKVTSYQLDGKYLSQINYYDRVNGKLESYDKYTYDAKNRLVKAVTHAGTDHVVLSEQEYFYSDNNLLSNTATTYYNGSTVEYSTYSKYEYSAAKNLKKKTVYEKAASSDSEGIAKSFTTYDALPNGNYSQEQLFVVDEKGQSKLFSTTTHSHDSALNPFINFTTPGVINSPNNLLASSVIVHGSNKVYKYTYSYKYAKDGYPISQTVYKPNGEKDIYTYRYFN